MRGSHYDFENRLYASIERETGDDMERIDMVVTQAKYAIWACGAVAFVCAWCYYDWNIALLLSCFVAVIALWLHSMVSNFARINGVRGLCGGGGPVKKEEDQCSQINALLTELQIEAEFNDDLIYELLLVISLYEEWDLDTAGSLFTGVDAGYNYKVCYFNLMKANLDEQVFEGYLWRIDIKRQCVADRQFFVPEAIDTHRFNHLHLIDHKEGQPYVYARMPDAQPFTLPQSVWLELLAVAQEMNGHLSLVALRNHYMYVAISADDLLDEGDVLNPAKKDAVSKSIRLLTSLPSRLHMETI